MLKFLSLVSDKRHGGSALFVIQVTPGGQRGQRPVDRWQTHSRSSRTAGQRRSRVLAGIREQPACERLQRYAREIKRLKSEF